MGRFPTLFLLLLSGVVVSGAQTAATEARIGTGTVEARIVAGGPLVSEFRIPAGANNQSIEVMKDISLWVGGIDAGANLLLSIQGPTPLKSDFAGGFRNLPQSARVWKVTKQQINQHVQDFEDNGVIDNPITEIFAWPGEGNPFSMALNGFATDTFNPWFLAPFNALGAWGIAYNPAEGHYPFLGSVIYNHDKQPDEMLFVPFHVKTNPEFFPGTPPVLLEGSAFFFTYYCDEVEFLDHTVYGYVSVQFQPYEQLDSIYAGIKVDAFISNPPGDYLGSIPGNSVTYFYASDTTIDQTTGKFPPVAGVDLQHGLIDSFGNFQLISSVLPILVANGLNYPPQTPPETPIEYYRYLTGHWRDGIPLTTGDIGYGGSQITRLIFPDFPGQSTGWSELNAGTVPGQRSALIATGPAHSPKTYINTNRLFFALNFVPGDRSLSGQWHSLMEYSLGQEAFFYGDFFPPDINPFDTLTCFKPASGFFSGPGPSVVNAFPNPAKNQLTVDAGAITIRQLVLYNATGSPVRSTYYTSDATSVSLNIQDLAAGMYHLHGVLEDHRYFTRRIVIAK